QVTALAWQALKVANQPPLVFSYGGSMAMLESTENGAPLLRLMNQDLLRGVLARTAHWYRFNKRGFEVDALPPMHVVRYMLDQLDNKLSVLSRIVGAPVFASNGSLHLSPGYNAESRCYFAPTNGLNIRGVSPVPSSAEISDAVKLITEDLIGEF